MLKFYQFSPSWNLPNASPFCMKVETFLRMHNIDYETYHAFPKESPTKKLPYVELDGQLIADSSIIIDELKKKFPERMCQPLAQEQEVLSLALQRMFEEHLFWAIDYSRWIEDENFSLTKDAYFSNWPESFEQKLPEAYREHVRKALHLQGLGRLSKSEIYKRALKDLEAVRILLEKNTFLVSDDEPTDIDCVGYAFIANILQTPIESPLKAFAQKHVCFTRYLKTMDALYFP